jgi:hypothetical protein
MFHHRPTAFATNVSAIEGRVRALENELERIARTAGRHTSAGMSAAGDHVGDAIASAVTEIVDRFRGGRRLAGDQAVLFGNGSRQARQRRSAPDGQRGRAPPVGHSRCRRRRRNSDWDSWRDGWTPALAQRPG